MKIINFIFCLFFLFIPDIQAEDNAKNLIYFRTNKYQCTISIKDFITYTEQEIKNIALLYPLFKIMKYNPSSNPINKKANQLIEKYIPKQTLKKCVIKKSNEKRNK